MQAPCILNRPIPPSLSSANSAGWWSFIYRNCLYPRIVALFALLFCLLGAQGRAESNSIPDAPTAQQHVFTLTDWTLVAGTLTGRALDFISTQQALHRGYQEQILPSSVTHSPVKLAVWESAASAAEIAAQRELTRHGHRKLARSMAAVRIGLSLGVDAHNYSLPAPTPSAQK